MARLTSDQVREIRTRYEDGETQVRLAAAYGVCQPHISDIVRRKTWKSLSESDSAHGGGMQGTP